MILIQTTFSQNFVEINRTVPKYCANYQTTDFSSIIASDNVKDLYVSYQNGNLVSINAFSMQKLWETNLGGEIISTSLVTDDKIFVATRRQKNVSIIETEIVKHSENKITLHFLNKLTGIAERQIELDGSGPTFLYSYTDEVIVIVNSGETYSISKNKGTLNWKQNLSAEISAVPYKLTDKILIGTKTRHLCILTLKNGLITGRLVLPEVPTVITADSTGENFAAGDRKGNLRSVKLLNQSQNWRSRQGAEISAVDRLNNGLLVNSFDNFIYMFGEKSGNMIWKRRMAGRVKISNTTTGDYFIAVSINEPTAVIINPADGKFLSRVTLENGNFFSGGSIRLGDLLIFPTRNGIFSFSLNSEPCPDEQNKDDRIK